MAKCPKCGAASLKKNGSGRMRCTACGHSPKAVPGWSGVRTLVIDIETRPAQVYTFNLKNAFIGPNQVVEWPAMLCFAAKWTDSDEVMFYADWTCGHRAMVLHARRLLDEADEVVGWNSTRFDLGWIDSELDRLGERSATPVRSLDLMKIKKAKQGSFPSFKLDSDARYLGRDGKLSTGGFDLWRAVIENGYAQKMQITRRDARDRMAEYNKQDVLDTEERYHSMVWRGMIKGNHNIALGNGHVCSSCGSEKLRAIKPYRTDLSEFPQWLCDDCGATSRGTKRNPLVRAELKRVA